MTNTTESIPLEPFAELRAATMTETAWTLTSCRNSNSPLSLSISAWLTKRLRSPDRDERLLVGMVLGEPVLLDMIECERQYRRKRLTEFRLFKQSYLMLRFRGSSIGVYRDFWDSISYLRVTRLM